MAIAGYICPPVPPALMTTLMFHLFIIISQMLLFVSILYLIIHFYFVFYVKIYLLFYIFLHKKNIGNVLFSLSLSSAFRCLTSVFGMGTGEPPSNYHQYIFLFIIYFFQFSENKIMCHQILGLNPQSISTSPLNVSLHFHFQPIYHVVFMGFYILAYWENSSQRGLHAQMLSAFIPSAHSYSALPLA